MYKNRKAIKALIIFYAVILGIMFIKAPSFFSIDNAMDILPVSYTHLTLPTIA